jgi:CheY-like chemotaxis protein
MLPKMNGFELYKIMKAIDPDVKICLMTAYELLAADQSRDEFEKLCPRLAEECILKKPFERKELFSKLWQILNGSRVGAFSVGTAEREQVAQRPTR